MSSHDRLDAGSGREVVYCHNCHEEWYRDAHPTLQCPNCQGEITEIIEPDNDPRDTDLHGVSFPADIFSRGFHRHAHDREDSDPGEEDIEDHMPRGGERFFVHQRIFPGPGADADRGGRPDDDMAVFQRFTDMLMNDFRAGGRDRPESAFDGRREGTRPRIQGATIATGPGGFRGGSFTIGFGPAFRRVGPNGDPQGPPDFDRIFGNLMTNVPPPARDEANRQVGSPPPPLMATLQDLLATLLNPGAAVHGDAVYTQEALDRIITRLMEANPQSNAAPPASSAALEALEKKPLDDAMIGSDEKVECTICIDELKKGDEVTVLPCKHFFHRECVVEWLMEHNTCPICRNPIEKPEDNLAGSNANAHGPNAGDSNPLGSQNPESTLPDARPRGAFAIPLHSEVLWDSRSGASPTPQSHRGIRTPQQNEERLNAIRNLRDFGSRRSSHSPPSRESGFSSTVRARSPSQSRDRDEDVPREPPREAVRNHWGHQRPSQRPGGGSRHNSDNGTHDHGYQDESNGGSASASGSSSHANPFSWIRDRMTRDRGSGSGSDGGRRRS